MVENVEGLQAKVEGTRFAEAQVLEIIFWALTQMELPVQIPGKSPTLKDSHSRELGNPLAKGKFHNPG
jgi:hypothetical protein